MKDYQITIILNSSAGTQWQSDTIFGHLCWQVAYGALGISIDDFLLPFRQGKPPFILSDGFPDNKMPRPLLDLGFKQSESLDDYTAGKKQKKAPYYSLDDFISVCHGEKAVDKPCDDPWEPVLTEHASLNRITNTTGGKDDSRGLYETEAYCLTGNSKLNIYLRCEPDWHDKVVSLLKNVSEIGFGKDKSVGLGAFEVESIEEFERFGRFNNANGFVSLSSMTPAADDPTDARFRLRTKYGKLGEGVFSNPFKKPLLQMEAGAAFKTNNSIKDYYGRIVEGIAPGDDRVVQNCYAYVVPCMIKW